MKRLSKEEIELLPKEVKEKIYNMLKSYDGAIIEYEDREYKLRTYIGITSNRASDYKFIGTVYAEDIYTSEERAKNYEEEFGYPCRVKLSSNLD